MVVCCTVSEIISDILSNKRKFFSTPVFNTHTDGIILGILVIWAPKKTITVSLPPVRDTRPSRTALYWKMMKLTMSSANAVNSRDAICYIQSTFRFRYIFRNYRKAYCTPSTASTSTSWQTLFTVDARESKFLFQQLSVALQRGNAVSFQNTFTAR